MTIARLSLALLFAIGASHLDAASALAAGADAKEAKKHYKLGKKLFGEGKYAEALPELLEANRLDPNPTLVKNIAKTYQKMDNIKGAAAYLQTVIDSQRPKKAVKWAENELESLSEDLQALNKDEVEQAKKAAAAEAKAAAEAEAKKREEQLKKEQAEEERKRAEEDERRRVEHEKKRKAAIEENKSAEQTAGRKRLIAYSAAGLAVAAAGGGVTFGLQALSAKDEVNKCAEGAASTGAGNCSAATYRDRKKDLDSAALLADISWIAFGAGGIAAVVFYLMAESDRASAPAVPPPYDELTPQGHGGGAEGGDKDAEPKPEAAPAPGDAGGESQIWFGPTGVGVVGTF